MLLTVFFVSCENTKSSSQLVSLSVAPANSSIELGSTQLFIATGVFSDNSSTNISPQITWTTSDASMASIDANGLAAGTGVGTVVITASLGTISGSAAVTVTDMSWSAVSYNDDGKEHFGVVWSGTQFVAVGSEVLTSPDGIHWAHPKTFGSLQYLYGITWSGTTFVAVGGDGQGDIHNPVSPMILTSPDATAWTAQSAGTMNGALFGAAWSGETFAAVGGDGAILTSPDGVTWTQRNSDPTYGLYAVAWNGSIFAAVGGQYNTLYARPVILTSADGITWTRRNTEDAGAFGTLWGITYAHDTFVAVGDTQAPMTSHDGITWSLQHSTTVPLLRSVAWTGALFVAVGDVQAPEHGAPGLYTVAVYPYGGVILTSPDGENWTAQITGSSNWLAGVACSGTKIVVVGRGPTILTSP